MPYEQGNWPADRVERKKISELVPYASNARIHSPQQVKQIAASMKEWGWTNPILIDEQGGIIAGHGRVLAAQALSWHDVPVMVASGWTDAQKRAYVIADNQLALTAEWDTDVLAAELDSLRDMDFDLSLIGFNPDELNDLIGTPNTGFDPDEVPPAPVVPVSRTGDLWLLGAHRLLCDRCPDALPILGDISSALLLTDPPYGISIVRGLGTIGGAKPFGRTRQPGGKPSGVLLGKVGGPGVVKPRLYMPIEGDDSPFDPVSLLAIGKHQIIFGGTYFATSLRDGTAWIAWDKGVSDEATFSAFELAWTSFEGRTRVYRHRWSGMVRAGIREEEMIDRVHPTQKPVGMIVQILEDIGNDFALICDPYLGSGTTLIACEKLGRACMAMEIEPHYVDVSVLRWQKFTGKAATLDGDGRSFDEVKLERKQEKVVA